MHKGISLIVGVAIGGLLISIDARAQLSFAPGELYICSYVNGSDYDDFNGAVRNWQRWMDEKSLNSYNGVALRPFYYSAETDYDIVWLGGWTSGAAEGEHNSQWISDAQSVIEGFNRAVACDTHSRWVLAELRPFETPPQVGGTGMAEFRNCTIKENRNFGDAIGALNQWLEVEAQMNIGTGHLLLVPVAGGASTDTYDFKWVIGFPSYASHGASADAMIRTGGGNRFNQIIANVMTCDSPRVYTLDIARVAE